MKKKEQDKIIIADILKAIAHPNRLSILALLGKKESNLSVTQICDILKLSQPEVSRHLSILKGKGILLFKRTGSHIFYSLNEKNLVFNCLDKLKLVEY